MARGAGGTAAASAPRITASVAGAACASTSNRPTSDTSPSAWCSRLCAAAAACSTSAAFCCVTPSICVTARLTCSMPVVCSALAAEISPMICVTRPTAPTISSMVRPACSAWRAPSRTCCTEPPISPAISLAAAEERCARLRTSAATTAKPRPCSPARAASTAALSARILVWKAMLSITPVISATCDDDREMVSMVCTTSRTARPPSEATSDAFCASWLAWRALSAFWRTVEVSCSIDAAVCCSDAACWPVRTDRSALPREISRVAPSIEPEARWIPCTRPDRWRKARSSAASMRPVSSRLRTATR
ncbi:hypothetical protein D3C81_1245250 [compost metagenome]